MDDVLRRSIIQMLMCNFELSIPSLEQAYPITFAAYFATEMEKLRGLEQDGLLEIDDNWITVSPKGRLLIRNICMVFDRHLNERHAQSQAAPLRYSKTI
jgi:oxygen-independent coproporphyrinogen-3 oxidase